MSRPTARAIGLVTALALAVPAAAASIPAQATEPSARAADVTAPFSLWAPKKLTVSSYKNRTWTDLGLRMIAEGGAFELWSHRPSYDQPIETTWRSPGGDVELPAGAMNDFSGLKKFLTVSITPTKGGDALTLHRKVCLNGYSERVRPDAPATSAYPTGCWYNPFSLGSVQGIQEGWATPILQSGGALRIGPGKYDVVATIKPKYADMFGLTAAQATRKVKLTVTSEEYVEGKPSPTHPVDRVARPAAQAPTGPQRRADEAGPMPDLRSLPAWGISVGGHGNYLRFSATVWNAGDSPLVVDGFRRNGEDLMDAYQYFFAADGTQTGYQDVGHMHWDAKPSHQHWHFEDFARYSLLKKDKTEAKRSKKEAFCLANTDAVDLTVPDAAWKPENTDLATSCGDYSSLSIREVLAAGWGDTYTQYRAGQSFGLKGLPNGTYFIAVDANPEGNLVESDTTNNLALRKVVIGGKEGARTVRVPQVGIIKEEGYGGTG